MRTLLRLQPWVPALEQAWLLVSPQMRQAVSPERQMRHCAELFLPAQPWRPERELLLLQQVQQLSVLPASLLEYVPCAPSQRRDPHLRQLPSVLSLRQGRLRAAASAYAGSMGHLHGGDRGMGRGSCTADHRLLPRTAKNTDMIPAKMDSKKPPWRYGHGGFRMIRENFN